MYPLLLWVSFKGYVYSVISCLTALKELFGVYFYSSHLTVYLKYLDAIISSLLRTRGNTFFSVTLSVETLMLSLIQQNATTPGNH